MHQHFRHKRKKNLSSSKYKNKKLELYYAIILYLFFIDTIFITLMKIINNVFLLYFIEYSSLTFIIIIYLL